MRKSRLILGGLLFALGSVMFVLGCNGGGHASYDSQKRDTNYWDVHFADDGSPIIHSSKDGSTFVTGRGNIEAPPGGKDSTTLSMSDTGTVAGIGSTYAPAAIDYINRNQGALIYVGAGMIVVGVIVMFLPWAKLVGLSALGLPLMIAGTAVCFLPSVLKTAGPIVGVAVGLAAVAAMVCGVVWLIAHRSGKSTMLQAVRKRSDKVAATLVSKGRADVAAILRRTNDPSYDAQVKAATVDAAANVALAGDPLATTPPPVQVNVGGSTPAPATIDITATVPPAPAV